MTSCANDLAHLDGLRDRLLEAALPHAPFDGWTHALLERAERDAGLPAGTAALVCPAGVIDLIDYWALRCDRAVETRLAESNLSALKNP